MNGPNNKIGWCDFTANPVRGKCQHACSYCYAEAIRKRYKWPAKIEFKPNWFNSRQGDKFIKKHERFPVVFVGSMHDIFGEWIPSAQIQGIINLCAKKDACRFVFCTKNPKRYQEFKSFRYLDNCILATTVTCQEDEWRIVELLKTDCCCRMLSIEPMLGPVNLKLGGCVPLNTKNEYGCPGGICGECDAPTIDIDWVVLGCESGPHRRPCEIEWMIDIVEQCQAAGVPVFVKQVSLPKIKALWMVRSDIPGEPLRVIPGKIYKAIMNKYGAISAITKKGILGLKPDEFEVVGSWVSHNPNEWPKPLQVREKIQG